MNIELGAMYQGPCATAVQVIVTGDLPHPDAAAHIATYFINAPGQSPAWENYVLSCVHLRAVEGETKPAVIRAEGATHEFLLYACDPDANPVPDDPDTWHALRPLNLEHQVRLPSDRAAANLCRLAAEAVCNGILWAEPPLAGQRQPWAATLDQTAAHARGEHGGLN